MYEANFLLFVEGSNYPCVKLITSFIVNTYIFFCSLSSASFSREISRAYLQGKYRLSR